MTRPTRPRTHLVPLGLLRHGRRVVRSGDGGASLIYALIFITIAAVALGAILAFADTSMRTTIALRSQASQAAAADGAAQVAINTLRQGTFVGTGSCLGASNSLALSNFYQSSNGAGTYSATVTCTQDTVDSSGGGGPGAGLTLPDDAILTLDPLSSISTEKGLELNANGSPNTLKIRGPIFSNSDIWVDELHSVSRVGARGICHGSITAVPPITSGTAAPCNIGDGPNPLGSADPDYAKPTASTALQTVPSCRGDNNVVPFTPGLYTDLASLNRLTRHGGSGCNGVFWFQPGVYYFNFGGNGIWTIDNGYVIGGTHPGGGPMPDGAPTIPGACESPVPPDPPGGWTDPGPGKGVEFVFGGISQIVLDRSSMELCGNQVPGIPPIAIYGLKSPVGPVPAQSDCVVAVGGCTFLHTTQSPNNAMYIDGTTYVPRAAIDVSLNNNTGQVFGGGVIARRLSVNATASTDLTNPIISLPGNAGPRSTVIYLAVYVCPGTTACSTTGGATPQLKVKVGIVDPSGSVPVAGARQVTVYAWSNQR